MELVLKLCLGSAESLVLRDCFLERFLWVDAIFINQKDKGVDADRSIYMTRTMRQCRSRNSAAGIERLLTSGANVNAEPAGNNGRTALQAASEGGHLAVVERLRRELERKSS
jgi:hypothetical protein